MKIYGKLHDYYDSALVHGHDDRVRFQRDRLEIPFNGIHRQFFQRSPVNEIRNGKMTARLDAFCICFCGKLYRGIKVLTYSFGYPASIDRAFYKFDELMTALRECELTYESSSHFGILSKRNIKALEAYFEPADNNAVMQYMVDQKYAIMTIAHDHCPCTRSDMKVVVNDTLKEFEFYRVLNAYEAYQELDMFVGGVLTVNEDATSTITDKDRIVQHGFDKYSFRKPPQV